MRPLATFLLALLLARFAAAEDVYPGKEWETATPASQGMDAAKLTRAAEHALKHGGGSGCVIRHGRLVAEWGPADRLADIKSCTKGAVGATVLGLAVDGGLVELDDRAAEHYPKLGQEVAANAATGWLARITVRHLATMTAGFDDGRPPKLAYEPGTRGTYSNDTSNMLAELLTLKFKEDLAAVLRRKVMDPIGVPADQWRWRANQFRARTIDGLPSREFASGITITHRALARIGYLYLRGGRWEGKQVLSRGFVAEALRPTDLPAPFKTYAFYWASNARGTYAKMPRDAAWALGLGDSLVVVCPSLDVVAVRLGTGSKKSQLPGGDEDWGARVEGFFSIVASAVREQRAAPATRPAARADRPYPPSPVIAGVDWAPADTIRRAAPGSDNWPIAWADDDALYAAYGDGHGFDPPAPRKLSLGLARITGGPADFVGVNLTARTVEQLGDGKSGRKASGMICVRGTLFLWLRNAGNGALAWSADRGRTWEVADWKLETSFGCPTFLQAGRDNAGALDEFVYVYSPDADSAYAMADRMVLARVPADRVKQRSAYEFFERLDAAGRPVWTSDVARRGAVFERPGRCYRSHVSYAPALKRYLWVQVFRSAGDGESADLRRSGGLAIFDAPAPWGPWTTAFFADRWDVAPGESASLPPKWMSPDGLTMHLVFSGDDAFSVRRGTVRSVR